MVNLMAVDAQRLMDLTAYVNVLWSSPLTILIALYFLYDAMGPSVLAGVGVLVLLIPLNMVVSRIARKLQVRMEIQVIFMQQLGIKVQQQILVFFSSKVYSCFFKWALRPVDLHVDRQNLNNNNNNTLENCTKNLSSWMSIRWLF